MSFTDLPQGATVVAQPKPAAQFTDLPPGASVVKPSTGGQAQPAKPVDAQSISKLFGMPFGMASKIAGELAKGVLEIPENYFRAAAGNPPGQPSAEAVQAGAAGGLLATGRAPGALRGVAEAAPAIEAAAPIEPGPWSTPRPGAEPPGGSVPVPPGGASAPSPPPEVAAALDKALPSSQGAPTIDVAGGAAKYRSDLQKRGFSKAEQDELVTEYQRQAESFNKGPIADLSAIQSEGAGAPAPTQPLADSAGQGAVERALQAPGWIKPAEPLGPTRSVPSVAQTPAAEAVTPATVPTTPDESAMATALRIALPHILPRLMPAGLRTLTRVALRSPQVYRWVRGVDRAAGNPAQLGAFQKRINGLANGDRTTRDLLQQVVVAANAPGSPPPGKP